MTIVPDRDLQSALNDALSDAFPTTPIAWENVKFTPTVGTTYFRVWLLPAKSDVMTLGTSPWIERGGIFQVSVFAPIGTGFGAPKGKAAEVVAAFKPNTSFSYNGLLVIIDHSWISSGMNDEAGWYAVPINIQYRCYFVD
jgi:hypothetical protein